MRVITLILVTAFILGFSCEDRKKGKVDDTIHLPPESPTPTPTLNPIPTPTSVE